MTFIFTLLMWLQKKRGLFEIKQDLWFLEEEKGVQGYSEDIVQMRSMLKTLNEKEQKDLPFIQRLSFDIAKKEELLNRYRLLLGASVDVEQYLKMLWR
ncbi:MAG: hypothetical protein A3F67_11830 [Verrucomicrobia bacterium RIFCSPHIGHO2_12_FULL_41_10]|nr:MAG: hypothetical protein A3F67_11830 [Verrucomicrobia bacterium RIFCSPHIGHO2_12_FULL_41_10]HLB57396.1 hypothetical protein [Gammaproteobacteria bacterium]